MYKDTKGVIRIRKSNDRHHNGQMSVVSPSPSNVESQIIMNVIKDVFVIQTLYYMQ